MCDDAACADGGAFSDGDAGGDDGAAADPDVVANGDGKGWFQPFFSFFGVKRVGGCVYLYVGPQKDMVADYYWRAVEDGAVEVAVEAVAYGDVIAVIAVKGRCDFRRGSRYVEQQV